VDVDPRRLRSFSSCQSGRTRWTSVPAASRQPKRQSAGNPQGQGKHHAQEHRVQIKGDTTYHSRTIRSGRYVSGSREGGFWRPRAARGSIVGLSRAGNLLLGQLARSFVFNRLGRSGPIEQVRIYEAAVAGSNPAPAHQSRGLKRACGSDVPRGHTSSGW
jgi:hypothetical protein